MIADENPSSPQMNSEQREAPQGQDANSRREQPNPQGQSDEPRAEQKVADEGEQRERLQAQIWQSLRPVLANFQQEMTETVRHEVQQALDQARHQGPQHDATSGPQSEATAEQNRASGPAMTLEDRPQESWQRSPSETARPEGQPQGQAQESTQQGQAQGEPGPGQGQPPYAQAGGPPQGQEAAEQEAAPEAVASALQLAMQETVRQLQQTVQWVAKTVQALLQTVRYLLQTVVSLLKTLLVALQQSVLFLIRPLTQLLGSTIRNLLSGIVNWVVRTVLRAGLRMLVQWLQAALREPLEQTARPSKPPLRAVEPRAVA